VLHKQPYSAKRFGYEATAAGRDLLPVLLALGQWSMVHAPLPDGVEHWEPSLLEAVTPST